MNKKTLKKILYGVLLLLDFAITVFLLVLSIIMIVKSAQLRAAGQNAIKPSDSTFIGYLQNHPTVYGFACVMPLFVLLAVNIIVVILYVRKNTSESKVQVSDLNEDEKKALRAEILKDLQSQDQANPDETKKEEEKPSEDNKEAIQKQAETLTSDGNPKPTEKK